MGWQGWRKKLRAREGKKANKASKRAERKFRIKIVKVLNPLSVLSFDKSPLRSDLWPTRASVPLYFNAIIACTRNKKAESP
jgi:hypothetical protein